MYNLIYLKEKNPADLCIKYVRVCLFAWVNNRQKVQTSINTYRF